MEAPPAVKLADASQYVAIPRVSGTLFNRIYGSWEGKPPPQKESYPRHYRGSKKKLH